MSTGALRRSAAALGSILGVLAVAAGVVALVASLAVEEPVTSGRVAGVGPQGRVPQFKVECGWSHAAPDDPIVLPGEPGASHLHDFFGNTATGARSTAAGLRGGETTCQNRLDAAAYWAPALLVDGTPTMPLGSVAYYRPGVEVDPASLTAYPAGLVMLAGDPSTSGPQPLEVAAWHCGASPILHASPPTCPETAPLGMRIAFPDCWDGEHLDSEDHRSHVGYSDDGRCPSDHPVATPQLIFEVHYPVTGDPSGLTLASGDVHGVHADFLNAWDQDALEREVRVCLHLAKVCGVVSNRATG